jgi:hypothetical protein
MACTESLCMYTYIHIQTFIHAGNDLSATKLNGQPKEKYDLQGRVSGYAGYKPGKIVSIYDPDVYRCVCMYVCAYVCMCINGYAGKNQVVHVWP